MPDVLITGANRGLGLDFVRQYAEAGWRVLACCRAPEAADALQRLAGERVSIHRLDVSAPEQVEALAAELADQPIDLLLNNAGIYGDRIAETRCGFGSIDYAAWGRTFAVNTMGPMRVTEAFIDNVERGQQKKIVIVTSKMGSIADNTGGGSYLYRSSKSAVNMVARSLSIDLRPRGITVIVIHPGWVRTDMGGEGAPLGIEQSVSGMRAVITQLTPADSGSFKLHDGTSIPW